MKRRWTFVIAAFFLLGMAGNIRATGPDKKWIDNKYSMFIHWGLYSLAGGVWEGKPVEQGYSEQIQSFAGIFSDYYAALSQEFTASRWNADSIVLLAKAGGMGSVVFTAKHHDGFSMYKTDYSKYNVVEATPFSRDPLKELSEACIRYGLQLGIYFSLIDWHFPQAYPISSHNADPVTPEHHRFNMEQVRELLTNYGPVSEMWFDMGSLTREQSRELYELVKELQPQCMVSGRLGNDFGDFAVMADNAVPDDRMGIPWQSAVSMFRETWGYRSWQQRGRVEDKVAEKGEIYKNVLKHGGHFLLNIGPRGDGSIVDFERDVILGLAGEMARHPGKDLMPDALPGGTNGKEKGKDKIACELYPVYGYSCFDYYSSFRSIIGYEFFMERAKKGKYVLVYHEGDRGKMLDFTVDWGATQKAGTGGNDLRQYRLVLEGGVPVESVKGLEPDASSMEITESFLLERERSRFDERFIDPGALAAVNNRVAQTGMEQIVAAGWKPVRSDHLTEFRYMLPVKEKESIWFAHRICASGERVVLAEFGGADAMEIWLNGEQLFKKGYTNVEPAPEIIRLSLHNGENWLVVKLHNRFENEIRYRFSTNVPQRFYQLALPLDLLDQSGFPGCRNPQKGKVMFRPADACGGRDVGLRDLEIRVR